MIGLSIITLFGVGFGVYVLYEFNQKPIACEMTILDKHEPDRVIMQKGTNSDIGDHIVEYYNENPFSRKNLCVRSIYKNNITYLFFYEGDKSIIEKYEDGQLIYSQEFTAINK